MKRFILSNIYFVIGLVLTLSLLWPLFTAPYFTHHDDVQIIRIFEMDQCFKDRQIPCRWVPDLGGLYGYPIFNYYAPLPYYIGEVFYLILGSLLWSAKAIFALSFVGAYIFMYLLAQKLWGKLGGSAAAIFYSFAPYHALDFYVRGAMGEMWALMFFPAVFWAIIKLEEKQNTARMLLVVFTLAGLIISHNLATMIFVPLVIFWIVFNYLKKRNKKFLWFNALAFLLASLISSFYLLPAIVEKNLVHVDTTTYGYFSYTEHFKGLRKLLVERSWEYGSSIREVPGGERDGMSYQIGWIHLLGWILAIIGAKNLWKRNRWLSLLIIGGSIAISFSIFMVHPRSLNVWNMLPMLKYLQFPWRFLILIIFLTSFLSGSIFVLNFKKKYLLWIVMVILVVVSNFSYFKPGKFIQTTDQKLLTGENWDKQIKRSIFDYLPIYAKEPPAELATAHYEVLTGDSKVYDFNKGTNWITFKTVTNSHTIIRLSQYYFPNWEVTVDGKKTNVEYKNNNLGLMTIILGKGNHEISARLYDTPIRSFANILTLVGFSISAFFFITSFSKVRRWILYYKSRIN